MIGIQKNLSAFHLFFQIILLSLIFLNVSDSFAHGVEGISEGAGGLAIRALYDGGEAMSYAKVSISVPDSETVFQTGRTDRNGRFCFFPDTGGIWKIVVDDEMGHRLEMTVNADQNPKQSVPSVSSDKSHPLNKMSKVFLGISVILCLTALILWLNAGKILRKAGRF